jgi:RNA polymerase-binding transcription factor DksA
MDRPGLSDFKARLLAMRRELVGRLEAAENESLHKSRRDAAGDLSGYPLHMADAGSDNYLSQADLTIAGSAAEALQMLDEALRRIEEGTYGVCRNCGQDIADQRLRALPHARTCYECASRAEGR